MRRAMENGSQALCPTEVRTGRCDYEVRAGRPCRFLHVKLPKELSGIEGLVRSDLGALKWSDADLCYVCADELDAAQLPDFIESVNKEVEQIVVELSEEAERDSGF